MNLLKNVMDRIARKEPKEVIKPGAWTEISVIDALTAMGECPPEYTEDDPDPILVKSKEILGYEIKSETERRWAKEFAEEKIKYYKLDYGLARLLDDLGVRVLEEEGVKAYMVRKARKSDEWWNTVDIKEYKQEIPLPILEQCIKIQEKGRERGLNYIDFAIHEFRNTRVFDPFVSVSLNRHNHNRKQFFIAYWDEPGFNSEGYWKSATSEMEKTS